MSRRELPKIYDPREGEEKWYKTWQEGGYFHAQIRSEKVPYCIVIPPPNITGSLHIGHALNNTLQDIMIRWKRMAGYNVLWMPGTDHAGIATQNVVERNLASQGLSREVLGREKFVEKVWEWREESGRTIVRQLQRLGASCDWERERFTMDAGFSEAVREVFVRLYEEGLIYRSERLINWCPRCQTALSDIEVEHEETRGKLYFICYPFHDLPDAHITVATTRPETLLGDTGVAVHPEDDRYRGLVGRRVRLPLTDATIPIIADSQVDRAFGTGAVKITPAHDFQDYEIARRSGLPSENILTRDGRLLSSLRTGRYAGLTIEKARAQVIQDLQAQRVLEKVQDHTLTLGKCYRCRVVVEPFLSPQWFVRVNDPHNSLAAPAIEVVRNRRIRLVPEFWENNYFGWMENIKDWCISRQIWWGHQIPAWYCRGCNPAIEQRGGGEISIPADARPIVQRDRPQACPACRSADLIHDPDVLDTWFSSALWPFSTVGWPRMTREREIFYPTSLLVTSFDILFFWVARMIMMGIKFMGEVPFREVYIHPLVRDAQGQKMSKSKGNVIDPLVLMEKYGTDALRFALTSMASPGRDMRLSEERVAGYRNFANKIWNTSRFLLLNLPSDEWEILSRVRALSPEGHSLPDRWILSHLEGVIEKTSQALTEYRFDEAATHLYQFLWHEYCDWYVEAIKDSVEASLPVLLFSFDAFLRLLHPFMPFMTEEIWQALPHEGESLVIAPYPVARREFVDRKAEEEMGLIQDIISGIRSIRGELKIPPSQVIPCALRDGSAFYPLIEQNLPWVKRLARVSLSAGGLEVEGDPPEESVFVPVTDPQRGSMEVILSFKGILTVRDAMVSLRKNLADIEKDLTTIAHTLEDPQFISRAPSSVIDKEREKKRVLAWRKKVIDMNLTRMGAG